ncbi:trypsin-like peptidase domain-containing protein [Micromonospora sp. WMMD967]|uniref:nSTAND1 domain-containing NTPase n=1 Tax=Micromonospora sp. WMMD967 TaxID=3016101 RepID=UPI00241632E3|nr:trypsin-like peptidase domain-containing protein [Micromonospora sp. WMMD967]MDG4838746.1 trypsin-like peptidase domain-containing protein [Micromonospora sp. WMMD967]
MAEDISPAAALGRLRGRSGQVVGTAFLVTADLVITCAHVVSAALGGDHFDAAAPTETVTIEFPLVGDDAPGSSYQGSVVSWWPARLDGSGDTAVLRLDRRPPVGIHPARLTLTEPDWGDKVRVFGFPADLTDEYGVWVEAELRARQGAGWLQVESPPHQRGIGQGFSGSPVWSPAAGIIGMVVAAERGNTTAYLIPVRTLVEAHPDIAAPDPTETSPYRGLEPFLEEHSAYFRGREALTKQVIRQVERHPLVTLVGPSGSGKSSLVYAGLTPSLRRLGMLVTTFRPLPGARSTSLLANAVIGVLDPTLPGVGQHDEAEALADMLDTTPTRTLSWLADQLVEKAGDGGLLLFCDQFEELAAEDAQRLWRLLHDLLHVAPHRADGTPRLHAVLTMRSGALDLLVTEDTAEAATVGMVFVPPMTRDQLHEVVTAADVDFEPGLVSRIIDDTGTEPGQLPLVEFTLAQLWKRRSTSTLTHRSYEELGGVSGALARYADDVYDALPASDRLAARRLFTQLARPEDSGDFLRRPVRLADLNDDLRPVLGRLAASRLVVVSRAADGAEIADLAHQALLRQWQGLREWLIHERDFRGWQEGLRVRLAAWEAAGRDAGGLLRGVALATANRWEREHPEDIGPAERAYITSSSAGERRRAWVLRSVVVVISLLALVASGLAVVAARQTHQADARLRTAASRALADEASRQRATDPRASLQLAQAAWHHDQTAEASGVTFTWYAALQFVERIYQDAWKGDLDKILASSDGSTVVFVNKSGLPAVWTGMNGENPQQWRLPTTGGGWEGGTFALSPSGRHLGYSSGLGRVALWDIAQRSEPIELARQTTRDDLSVNGQTSSVSFSPDGSRFMVWSHSERSETSQILVWTVEDGQPVRVTAPALPASSLTSVSFGPRTDTLLLVGYGVARLHQLDTGRLLKALPVPESVDPQPVSNGSLLAHCDPDRDLVQVTDVATGEALRTVPMRSCATPILRLDGPPYLVSANSFDVSDSNSEISVTDLRTGQTYRFTTPPIDFNPLRQSHRIALFGRPDGRVVALVGDRNQGYRLAATAPQPPAPEQPKQGPARPFGSLSLGSPDDRWEVAVNGETGRIDLVDVETRLTIASATGTPTTDAAKVIFKGFWCGFTSDGTRFLMVQGDELVAYSIPELTVEHRMRLPVQPEIGTPPNEPGMSAWASSVAADGDGRVIVLHAGLLTRWDTATGAMTDGPVPLRTDLSTQQHSALLAVMSPLPRPGHPGEVAVVEPNGEVEIWNIDRRRAIATFTVGAARGPGTPVFDVTGSRLAVRSSNEQVKIIDVDGSRAESSIPAGQIDAVLGFTPDGRLLTVSQSLKPVAQFWDDNSGKLLATLTLAASPTRWTLAGDLLSLSDAEQTRSLRLRPEVWMEHLCSLNERPYDGTERAVIKRHSGATERPCG